MRLVALLLVPALALGACQFPKDPEGTLNKVRDRGTIEVGVTHADPFVNLDGPEPAGVEVDLIGRRGRRPSGRAGAGVGPRVSRRTSIRPTYAVV